MRSGPRNLRFIFECPIWAGNKTSIAINGKSFPVSLHNGSFAAVEESGRTETGSSTPSICRSGWNQWKPGNRVLWRCFTDQLTLFAIDPAVGQFKRG